MESLPFELQCEIAKHLVASDLFALGRCCSVNNQWNLIFSEPELWKYLCVSYHPSFLASARDEERLLETMRKWKENPIEDERETKQELSEEQTEELLIRASDIKLDWKRKFLEWCLLDELLEVSENFFRDAYQLRLASAEFVSIIARSDLISAQVLIQFIPSPRSDLRVAAGIGLKEKFVQINEIIGEKTNPRLASINDKPVLHEHPHITKTALQSLRIAKNTEGYNESLHSLANSIRELSEALSNNSLEEFQKKPGGDPLFRAMMEGLDALLDDGASRVSFRGVAAAGISKPICMLFAPKLHRFANHPNPAVAEISVEAAKFLKKKSIINKLWGKIKK